MRPVRVPFRIPLLAFSAMLLSGAGLRAQFTVNPERLPAKLRNLEPQPDDDRLKCSVTVLKPALNFGFRFQAGYTVGVPMSQYRGTGHRWSILTRVTPEGGAPVYFLSRHWLPEVPNTNTALEVGGGYMLGEGRYRVAWKLQDETGRVCRKEWNIDARRNRSESKVKVAMAPESVTSLSNWTRGGQVAVDDAPPIRLSVLMHAAPSSPRRTGMTARDRVLLLGTLSSLLERLPTRSVRLVVFNLDQQRELYRQDDFSARAFNDVAQSLNQLELGLVDYHVLQNRRGHVDLLADILEQEVNAPEPSDVVIVLGPRARYVDKAPDVAAGKPPGASPRFFYFQYRPPFLRMQAMLPDVIHSAVSKLKGKTVIIHSPGDFAKGIDQVERGTR